MINTRIAFITGAAQGIGQGIALELARSGIDIVIGDLNISKAEKVVTEIKSLGRSAIAVPLDVTNTTSISQAVKKALLRFPEINILVNNAGVMQNEIGIETTDEDFDLCHAVNLKAIWRVTQEFMPHLKSQNSSKIVNIASGAGRQGSAALPAYSVSKAAVINLTQSLASVLAPFGINVNAVCPGLVWTPMWEKIEGMIDGAQEEEKNKKQSVFKKKH